MSEPVDVDFDRMSCPLPLADYDHVLLGHGSGGKLTAQLVQDLILPAFDNECLRKLDDQAVFRAGSARLAFTTDSFVVTPLFFPGGDIGELAVNGTVNDDGVTVLRGPDAQIRRFVNRRLFG